MEAEGRSSVSGFLNPDVRGKLADGRWPAYWAMPASLWTNPRNCPHCKIDIFFRMDKRGLLWIYSLFNQKLRISAYERLNNHDNLVLRRSIGCQKNAN